MPAARVDKERKVNEATAYPNEVVARAEAEGSKEQRISLATGEAQRFVSVYAAYLQRKDVTRRRIYLATMKDIMRDMDKVLIDNQMSGSRIVA
ncbi:MAG: hypothetical protein O7F69_12020 [Alphaproteobacteria bacterium]|nr:hypothetical protein [Alphaproteobacteria bacterium]